MTASRSAEADRHRLWALLGRLPPSPAQVAGRQIGQEIRSAVAIERWQLHLNPFEPVPALLTRPAQGPIRGAVLYQHAHGNRFDIGKDELVRGRPALLAEPYADALAARGWAALAIDHWGFGERAHTPERMLFKRLLWEGSSLWGRRVFDSIAAVNWFRGIPAFRSLPLVAFGMSMGSTLAWWTAALDPRVDAVVELCCLAEFRALLDGGGYDLHAEYFFVPGLFAEFTAAQINTLIVPRPHLSIAGRADPLTPAEGLESIDTALRAAYASAGAPDAWRQSVYPAGHEETPAMRDEVLRFLERIGR